ncbi:ABC transporter permease [Azorhizobium caulinodans]|nr:ABC transporter permease [Azorhizobium caulinodans]
MVTWAAVFQRNAMSWRREMAASVLGSVIDPLIMLFGLGVGLGKIVDSVDGRSYAEFLACGLILTSAMSASNYEMLYGTYSRIYVTGTLKSMRYAPICVSDYLIGEVLWAAYEGVVAGTIVAVCTAFLGYIPGWSVIYILPDILFVALIFSSTSLLVAAISRGYALFAFYQSIAIAPLVFLSGVIVPRFTGNDVISGMIHFSPLYRAVNDVRNVVYEGRGTQVGPLLLLSLLYASVMVFISAKVICVRLDD